MGTSGPFLRTLACCPLPIRLQARLWVTAGNTGFLGLTNQNSNPGPDGLAALRCVDKPAYDQYTQLLTWSVDWWVARMHTA